MEERMQHSYMGTQLLGSALLLPFAAEASLGRRFRGYTVTNFLDRTGSFGTASNGR